MFKIKKSLLCSMSAVALILSGCDEGGSSKQVSNIPQSNWKMQGESNGVSDNPSINAANQVWFAIDKNDAIPTNGKVNFLFDNNTGETATLVGCDQYRSDGTNDGSKIFNFNLGESIPASASTHYRKPKTNEEYLVRMGKDNNIISPVSEQEYKGSITSARGASERDYTGVCYYKIAVPNSNKYLYFGLNINSEMWRTYSAIFDTIDKPLNDLKEYQKKHANQFEEGFTVPTPIVALATVGLASKTNPIYGQIEFEHVKNEIIQFQKDVIAEVNKQAAIMNSSSSTSAEKAEARAKLFEKFTGDNSAQDLGKFRGSATDLNKFLDDFNGIYRYTGDWTDTVTKKTTFKDAYIAYDKNANPMPFQRGFDDGGGSSDMNKTMEAWDPWDADFERTKSITDGLIKKGVSAEELLDPVTYISHQIGGSDIPRGIDRFSEGVRKVKFGETGGKTFGNVIDKQSITKSAATSLIDENMSTVSDDGVKLVLRSQIKVGEEAVLGGIASTGIGLLVEVASWFSVMPVLNKIFDHGPVGQYNTGLMHGNLFIPSQDDVNKWNASHDSNHQIAYTTKKISDTDKDPTNSFRQSIGFTLNDGIQGEDRQIRYDIDLTYLTTPFLRITDSKGNSPGTDPYLQSSSEKSADGVFTLSINQVKPQNDAYDLNLAAAGMLKQAGLSAWVPNYLPAPTVVQTQVSEMSNNPSNPTLNLTGLKSMPMLSSKSGLNLMQVGAIKGLFIAPNTVVNLSVSVAKNGSSDQKYGTGFIANYISSGISAESTNPVYSVTGSQDEFNKLHSNLPLFYRAFTCNYPYTLGSVCNLSMAVGGNGNNGVDEGKLYLQDASGLEYAIPVYLGYKLVVEPRSIAGQVLNDGDGYSANINFANASSQRYSAIKVDGSLPSTVKIVSNSCENGLNPGAQCSIVYDFSAITKRVHTTLTYTGITDGQSVTKADTKVVPIDVSVEQF